jgi:flavin-binding protein dodecin
MPRSTNSNAHTPVANKDNRLIWINTECFWFNLIGCCSASHEEELMPDSVYNVIELVGTSTESFHDAAKAAVDMAAKSLRDLRVAEVEKMDALIKDGKVELYRAKLKVSFKYEGKG